MAMTILFLMTVSMADTFDFALDQAIDYALMNNPDVKQLTLEHERSQEQVTEALSGFYPQLTAQGSYVYLGTVPVVEFQGMQVPFGASENTSFSLSLQQVLFSWGKIYNVYKISDIGEKIAELSLERKKQEVRYAVADAFYGILVLQEAVAVSRQDLTRLEDYEEVVRTRYRAGLVSQFELLRAQVQIANFKPVVIAAENNLALAREGFKLLLGLPQTENFTLSGELTVIEEDFNLDELIETALRERIELKNVQHGLEIARLNRQIIRRTNLPTIVAGATYDYSKPYLIAEDEWGSTVNFNIGFQWPLFTGMNTYAKNRQATIAIQEAELAYETLSEAIVLEVKQGYLNLLAAREALATAEENVGQAEETFDIIETRYQRGLATNLEFTDAQLALRQAQLNYLTSLKSHYTSMAEIYKAIGKEE
jgi:outer membrane protein TolC